MFIQRFCPIVCLLAVIFGMGLVSSTVKAQDVSQEKLAELQVELRARQQVLENNKASAQELEQVLKRSELEIAKVAKALAQNKQQLNSVLAEEDALIEEQEGLKEARLCTGATTGSTSKGGTVIGAGGMGGFCIFPKYKDLSVFGNFILLCQGYDESEATKNCKKLLERLENN